MEAGGLERETERKRDVEKKETLCLTGSQIVTFTDFARRDQSMDTFSTFQN